MSYALLSPKGRSSTRKARPTVTYVQKGRASAPLHAQPYFIRDVAPNQMQPVVGEYVYGTPSKEEFELLKQVTEATKPQAKKVVLQPTLLQPETMGLCLPLNQFMPMPSNGHEEREIFEDAPLVYRFTFQHVPLNRLTAKQREYMDSLVMLQTVLSLLETQATKDEKPDKGSARNPKRIEKEFDTPATIESDVLSTLGRMMTDTGHFDLADTFTFTENLSPAYTLKFTEPENGSKPGVSMHPNLMALIYGRKLVPDEVKRGMSGPIHARFMYGDQTVDGTPSGTTQDQWIKYAKVLAQIHDDVVRASEIPVGWLAGDFDTPGTLEARIMAVFAWLQFTKGKMINPMKCWEYLTMLKDYIDNYCLKELVYILERYSKSRFAEKQVVVQPLVMTACAANTKKK